MLTSTTTNPKAAAKNSHSVGDLPKQLRPCCRKLKSLAAQQRDNFLLTNYEIGLVAKKGLDDLAKSGISTYGQDVVGHLAQEAGIDARTLRTCITLVSECGASEYKALIMQPVFSWSHIVHLLAVPAGTSRTALTEATVRADWTADQLAQRIHEQFGNRRPGSGRRPAVPRSADQGLTKLLSATAKFDNLLTAGIFGDEFDLPAALVNTAPDTVDEATREKAVRAAAALDAIARHAQEGAGRLRMKLPWIDQVLANKDK